MPVEGQTPPALPALADFARILAEEATNSPVVDVRLLQGGVERAVLRVTLADPPRDLVLKAAGPTATAEDFERTAAVSALARTAGAPVAAVLAADSSYRSGPWRFLLQEHVSGIEWHRLRPSLGAAEQVAAHRQIAAAVVAIQSVRFSSFGELNAAGRPSGVDLLTALRARAELRIPDPSRRAVFDGVLERAADLFHIDPPATLSHDDLHHANVLFRPDGEGWQLAGILDWDKSWAGHAESDIARMARWDDMTGPGFWEVYDAAVPAAKERAQRASIYQLLWCLEYDVATPRHHADTTRLCHQLGVEAPP